MKAEAVCSGMTENLPAVQEARQEIAEAQEAGDQRAANVGYSRELEVLRDDARAEQPAVASAPATGELMIADPVGDNRAVTVEDLPAEDVNRTFAVIGPWEGWNGKNAVSDLRSRWGADAGANLGYAESFRWAFPDVAQIFKLAELDSHPAIIEAAALLGRKLASRSGAPARPAAPSNTTERTTMSEGEGLQKHEALEHPDYLAAKEKV